MRLIIMCKNCFIAKNKYKNVKTNVFDIFESKRKMSKIISLSCRTEDLA